jgi:hypothetical protein
VTLPSTDTVHQYMITLTRWFAENLTLAGPGCEMDHHAELSEKSPNEIIDELRSGTKATKCGGLAVLLQQRARQDNIEAVALNFGLKASTHVIVAAKLTNGSYSLYCPTFGLTILNASDGHPASVELIAESLHCRQANRLRITRLTRQPVCMVYASPPITSAFHAALIKMPEYLKNGRIRYVVRRSMLMLWCARQVTLDIGSMTEDASVIDILRFPLSTSGEADAERMAMMLRAVP